MIGFERYCNTVEKEVVSGIPLPQAISWYQLPDELHEKLVKHFEQKYRDCQALVLEARKVFHADAPRDEAGAWREAVKNCAAIHDLTSTYPECRKWVEKEYATIQTRRDRRRSTQFLHFAECIFFQR